MDVYFNEIDPFAADWLKALYPQAHVDLRSIADVEPADVVRFTRCHYFGGIGGWQYALQLAGWSEDRPVWTGSCPCQPYSSAGKQEGDADPRNLWPQFFRLIRECRPQCIFGEQVASAIRHGWLDGISAGLEGEGYAVGSVVLGAHSVGAPHIRQRLFWVAKSGSAERGRWTEPGRQHGRALHIADGGGSGGLADSEHERTRPGEQGVERRTRSGWHRPAIDGVTCGVGDSHQRGKDSIEGISAGSGVERAGMSLGMGESFQSRLEGLTRHGDDGNQPGRDGALTAGSVAATGAVGPWGNFDIIPCRDGKARRVESGTFPLAHGVPARVGRLRGYGNAIVPHLAAAFITAFLQTE